MKIGLNDFFLSYCHFNGLLAQSCAIPMNKDFRSISRNTFERIPLAMSTRQFTCVTVFRTPAISSLPTNQIFILGHGTQIGLPTMTGLWEHAFHWRQCAWRACGSTLFIDYNAHDGLVGACFSLITMRMHLSNPNHAVFCQHTCLLLFRTSCSFKLFILLLFNSSWSPLMLFSWSFSSLVSSFCLVFSCWHLVCTFLHQK